LFFEALIVAMSKEMTVSSIAELVNIHEDSVWRILMHYVEEARSKVDQFELDTIGVDEISVNYPNAKIVYDRFHIIKMMNDVIDMVRRKAVILR